MLLSIFFPLTPIHLVALAIGHNKTLAGQFVGLPIFLKKPTRFQEFTFFGHDHPPSLKGIHNIAPDLWQTKTGQLKNEAPPGAVIDE